MAMSGDVDWWYNCQFYKMILEVYLANLRRGFLDLMQWDNRNWLQRLQEYICLLNGACRQCIITVAYNRHVWLVGTVNKIPYWCKPRIQAFRKLLVVYFSFCCTFIRTCTSCSKIHLYEILWHLKLKFAMKLLLFVSSRFYFKKSSLMK